MSATIMTWEVLPDTASLVWEVDGTDFGFLAERVQSGHIIAVVGPPGPQRQGEPAADILDFINSLDGAINV